MENNDIPVRATLFLRDPSTGLSQNGIYDIYSESKNRSVVITTRIANKKSRELQQESDSFQLLSWNVYIKQVHTTYKDNTRFINELRNEFRLFIELIRKHLLTGTFTSNDVSSANYFILRAVHRIYKQKQLNFGNDDKIHKFTRKIRDDITKYFTKISDKSWNEIYIVGLKLLYCLSPPMDPNQTLSDALKLITQDSSPFDSNSIHLFSKSHGAVSKANREEYKLNKQEYGRDIEFNDPLIEISQILLPQMTSLEHKQFSLENHKPSHSARFTNHKHNKNTTNGNTSKPRPPPKTTPKMEKYSVEWIRDRAQHIAMMKLQFEDGSEMMDVETLTLQILEVIHNTQCTDIMLQSQFTDLLGLDAFDLITQLIQNRALIVKLTSRYMNYKDPSQPSTQPGQSGSTSQRDNFIKPHTSANPYGATFSVKTESQKIYEKKQNKMRKKRGKTKGQKGSKTHRNDKVSNTINKQHENYKRTMELMGYKAKNESVKEEQAMPSNATTTTHRLGTGSWEEVFCPAPEQKVLDEIDNVELTDIKQAFPPWAQLPFIPFGIKKLNPMQSQCFEKAFNSNVNLLICAPTGAGKTNVAIMAALREIGANMKNGVLSKADKFKIVYVAPMKALAQEIVRKFGKRLKSLGIVCRELTGDMQLTKVEIAETHIIVTTPEKWDVITRKSDEVVKIVKLLILDEVHLLQDDRGSVIEALVARTNRLVESAQTMIRIVGLSATLPNYIDVAAFLKAENGICYFDQSYRPVPLSKSFIGVSDPNSMKVRNMMNEVCFIKVEKSVAEGHQVMVFVHSRKDTLRTAQFLREQFQDYEECNLVDPDPVTHAKMLEKITKKRGIPTELFHLLRHGFGTHHAGMRRENRKLVEEAFLAGTIKVLCCTATLAWGVNLPAHTVIIKGTTIYDTKRGGFVDVSILDVMQIFGRAGRPQFDKVGGGEAFIITEKKRMRHFVSSMTNAVPIESTFHDDLVNHLNAEIVLGSVTNMTEGIQWLQYTYLYVRLIRCPSKYMDMTMQFVDQGYSMDPFFNSKLKEMLEGAAMELAKMKMARFDSGENFYPTDVGRIASHYYIDCHTIGRWNESISNNCTVEDILDLVCQATEFEQLTMREEEEMDLMRLRKECCPYEIKSLQRGPDSPQTKANVLLQCYIGRQFWQIKHPTLINDLGYIKQNSGRIVRALFEISVKIGYSNLACEALKLCKVIEQQVWHHQTPLRQFHAIKTELCLKVERSNLKLFQLAEYHTGEIGRMIRDQRNAAHVKKLANIIPRIALECKARPITRTLLAVDISLEPKFKWVRNQHSTNQLFHIWVDDVIKREIYHHETYTMTDKDYAEEEEISVSVVLPIPEGDDDVPPQYQIHFVSAYWLGSHSIYPLSFQHLIRPEDYPPQTLLLDLHPLPIKALQNEQWESIYRGKFEYFNPIQTQVFHVAYHTDQPILMCAPTGSGKTVIAELVTFRSLFINPDKKVIYIAPLKALARERYRTWREKFGGKLGYNVIMLTGDMTPDRAAINNSHIIITTPEKWDGISRYWKSRKYVKKVGVIIFDEIHLLGLDRGPILEVIVSRLRFVERRILDKSEGDKVRLLGLSTALANAHDLADWLGVTHLGLYNFPAAQRPVPCQVHIQGYPGKHYCPRMATMNKPCYAAIKSHSMNKPVLIFVSSRRQTRLTAIDLISYISRDISSSKFLHIDSSEMNYILKDIRDANLRHTLAFGVGLHHAGLHPSDRKIVEDLFLNGCIQILVATATLAWGVNLPAHLVIVKGTEYFDPKTKRYVQLPVTDILQMIGRAGRPQFDTFATAVVLVHQPKKNFYKRFLYHSFPVESCLHENIHNHINAEIAVGTLKSMQDGIEYLTWTFLFRRIIKNPTYYQLEDVKANTINKYLRDMLRGVLWDLNDAGCIEFNDEEQNTFESTVLGQIASYYYMSYKTMAILKQSLQSDCSMTELIRILSSTTEYDELPVRHNEDKLNFELSKQVPYDVSDLAMDEPSTKAVLLFQAHFSRLQLPITDYVTDLRSVLDQSIRILQAMIDYVSCKSNLWLRSALKLINLIQMVTQGRWLNDSTLSNLPGITSESVLNFWKEGIETLPQLLVYPLNKTRLILKRDKELRNDDIEDIIATLRFKYPRIEVQLTLSSFDIGLDCDVTLLCRLRRYSGNPNKIYSPKWYKPKLEGWVIVIALHNCDKLLALKRCRVTKGWRTTRIKIHIPSAVTDIPGYNEEDKQILFDVYVMSDAYLGLDQFYTIQANLDTASANDDGNIDPFLHLETANDLIGLKESVSSSSVVSDKTQTPSVLTGMTFNTQLLGARNRPQTQQTSANSAAANTIQIDFDELKSIVTDIDNDDIQSILTQTTNIPKWD